MALKKNPKLKELHLILESTKGPLLWLRKPEPLTSFPLCFLKDIFGEDV